MDARRWARGKLHTELNPEAQEKRACKKPAIDCRRKESRWREMCRQRRTEEERKELGCQLVEVVDLVDLVS